MDSRVIKLASKILIALLCPERTFEKEVRTATRFCALDKSSRYDGKTMTIYQTAWYFIKDYIMGARNHFPTEWEYKVYQII